MTKPADTTEAPASESIPRRPRLMERVEVGVKLGLRRGATGMQAPEQRTDAEIGAVKSIAEAVMMEIALWVEFTAQAGLKACGNVQGIDVAYRSETHFSADGRLAARVLGLVRDDEADRVAAERLALGCGNEKDMRRIAHVLFGAGYLADALAVLRCIERHRRHGRPRYTKSASEGTTS